MAGTLTDKGLEIIAKIVNGVSGNVIDEIAIGSGTAVESTSDTALANEITTNGGARKIGVTATYEAPGKSVWSTQFDFSGDLAVNEIGLFEAANLIVRRVLPTTRNVTSGDSMVVNFYLTFTRV